MHDFTIAGIKIVWPSLSAANPMLIASMRFSVKQDRTDTNAAGFNMPIPIPISTGNVNRSWNGVVTNDVSSNPTNTITFPIITKLFADKFLSKKPVVSTVRFDKNWNKFIKVEPASAWMNGSNIIPKHDIRETLKIWNEESLNSIIVDRAKVVYIVDLKTFWLIFFFSR